MDNSEFYLTDRHIKERKGKLLYRQSVETHCTGVNLKLILEKVKMSRRHLESVTGTCERG
jgi:hypothetical protein